MDKLLPNVSHKLHIQIKKYKVFMNIDHILKAPFFHGMKEQEVLPLLLSKRNGRRNYKPNSFIVMQGDECRSMYLLTEGQVRTQMVNEEGKQITIELLEAPLMLAPGFVFGQNNRFPVNVETTKDCELILIDKELFLEFLHQYPIAMLNFIKLLSNRSQLLSARVNQFALQSLKSRLVNYIRLHPHIDSQQNVAQILGVARPSLARAISELSEEGTIISKGKEYQIINHTQNETL
jgi:CRP-like cAMP-binding protein